MAHVVTDLGPPESARRGPATPPIRKTTKPSMQAVIVPASFASLSRRPSVEIVENDGLEIRGDESTEPPPTTEGGDDHG